MNETDDPGHEPPLFKMSEKQPVSKNASTDSTLHAGRDVHLGDVTYIIQGKNVVVPRHLTNNIPVNAEHLIGRKDELKSIAGHLAQNRPTVLVNGIGGIGKTSVATKFMALHGHEYAHLAWFTRGDLCQPYHTQRILAHRAGGAGTGGSKEHCRRFCLGVQKTERTGQNPRRYRQRQ
jgi:hypothetical protein